VKAKFLILAGFLLLAQTNDLSHAAESAITEGNNTLELNIAPPVGERRVGANQVLDNAVETSIVIAVDVSGSIDQAEYNAQKNGLVNALLDERLQRVLTQCNPNGVAITYVEWSGNQVGPQVNQVLPWTRLRTPRDMINLANRLRGQPRSSHGDTDIATALKFAGNLVQTSPFRSNRTVISLSSDGRQSWAVDPVNLRQARNQLGGAGVVVNAIVIERANAESAPREASSLEGYFRQNVITGPGSSAVSISDYSGYADAIYRQLSTLLNACVS
jgi:Protein of unknown function (DUF1194)